MKVEKALYSGLKKHFQALVQKVNNAVDEYEKKRTDSLEDELFFDITLIEQEIAKEFEDDKIFGMLFDSFLKGYFLQLFQSSKSELNRYLSKFINTDLPFDDIVVSQHYNAYKSELTSKIKYWVTTYFTKLRNLNTKYSSGKITIGKLLKSISVLGQSIAKTVPVGIARDTIGTFSSKMQQTLFTASGFNLYVWSTALDERVRGAPDGLYPKSNPSHYIMEGLICRWDNEMLYSEDGIEWKSKYGKMEKSHVGIAQNCRCVALPYIKPILDELNRS